MSTLVDILAEVIAIVKDDSGKLTNPDDYETGISAALMEYSRIKPLPVIDDIYGDGTSQVNLPAGWTPEFSVVRSIEYPIGDFPPTVLDEEDYYITDRSGIVTLNFTLAATDRVRVTYTMLRTADDIPDIDLYSFYQLAAAHCLEILANIFLQTGDSTINADVVNYRSKSSEATARAKQLRKLYKEHMGVKEDDTTPAAAACTDMTMNYPGGADRLTHPRSARRRR